MPVLLNTGDRQVKAGTFDAVENLTQSTATLPQNINPYIPVTTLSGGTATGFARDIYVLRATTTGTATDPSKGGPAVEGVRKFIYMLATGEAKIQVESWATTRIAAFGFMASATVFDGAVFTATGAITFTLKGQYAEMLFVNQQWHLIGGFGSFATATS